MASDGLAEAPLPDHIDAQPHQPQARQGHGQQAIEHHNQQRSRTVTPGQLDRGITAAMLGWFGLSGFTSSSIEAQL